MRRGPGGGLFVAEPGVAASTEAVALHIHRLAITPAQLFEVRTAVEIAVLERGVERIDADHAAALRRALEDERAATGDELRDLAHGVHAVLAGTSGNRVLELLPALQRPTISPLSDEEWVAVNTIIEERTVRDLIPRLKCARAQGIVEYPLNKIVL